MTADILPFKPRQDIRIQANMLLRDSMILYEASFALLMTALDLQMDFLQGVSNPSKPRSE